MRKLVYATATMETTSYNVAKDWKAKGIPVKEKLVDIQEDSYPVRENGFERLEKIKAKKKGA